MRTLPPAMIVAFTFALTFDAPVTVAQQPASEDPQKALTKHIFRNAKGETLPYRLLVPSGYDGSKTYPLVLFLHGAGERGTDNARTLVHGISTFTARANREKFPCFVVVPQCPNGKRWVEVHWGLKQHKQPEQPSDPMRLTLDLLESLRKEYRIDESRLYVTGLSMGGFGTWDLIARKPRMFAAAVPICGGADESTAKAIAHIPVWAFHGDKDGAVPIDRSRNMIAALKKAGAEPRYTEYPGVGHNSWAPAYREAALLPWLFSQHLSRTD